MKTEEQSTPLWRAGNNQPITAQYYHLLLSIDQSQLTIHLLQDCQLLLPDPHHASAPQRQSGAGHEHGEDAGDAGGGHGVQSAAGQTQRGQHQH